VLEVTAYWEGGYRVRVPLRGFEIVSDEPAEYGGTNTGPMPTELFLSSLAVCFTMAVHHTFRKRNVQLPDLAVHVSAEYEGTRFRKIHVTVDSSHPRDEMRSLLPRAIGYCYVSNTLASYCDIEYSVADVPATGQPQPPPS